MRPFIVMGDRTDHGGVVIGSTQTPVGGATDKPHWSDNGH